MRTVCGVLVTLVVALAGEAESARAAIPAPPSTWYALAGLNAGAGAGSVRTFAHSTPPNVVYAGLDGGGTFRSTDGGATWSPFNAGFPDPPATRVRALLTSSTGATVYAGTDSGLFRSTGGAWAPLALGGSVQALLSLDAATSTLLAGVAGGGVYRSGDGGETWSAPGAGNGMPAGATITGLTSTVPGVVYATGDRGVYVSTDAGATWARRSDGIPAGASPIITWAYPQRPSQLFTSTDANGVYRSLNAGLTWAPINTGLGTVRARGLQIFPGSSTQGVHLYAATEDGLWEALSLGSAAPPAPRWHEVTRDGLLGPGYSHTVMHALTAPAIPGAGSLGLIAGTESGGGYFLSFEPPDSPCPSTPNGSTDCPRINDATPEVGQTLTLANGKWTGTDFLRFAYQWQRCTGSTAGTCTDIPDAEETTYVVPEAALDPAPNLSYRVEVTATNPAATFGIVRRFSTITSPAAANTGAYPGSNQGSPPSITVLAPGQLTSPQVGDRMYANYGITPNGFSDGWFNPQATTITFRWLRCAGSGDDCDEIPGTGAGARTYTVQPEDATHVLRVRVTGSNAAGTVQLVSDASYDVTSPPAAVADPLPSDTPGGPARSQAPSITGDAHPGETLAGDVGGWRDPTTDFLRRWMRCDAAGNACTVVQKTDRPSPEDGPTYVVRAEDLGSTLRLRVVADVNGDLTPDGTDDHAPAAVEVLTAPSAVVTVRPAGPGPSPDPGPSPAPLPPSPGPPTVPKDTTAPTLSALKASKASFVAGKGTTFSLSLSEPASLRIVVTRATSGRRVGKTCRPLTRANRKKRRCTYDRVVTTIKRPGLRAGRAKIAFSGKVGKRRLPVGPYKAAFVATDAAGNASKARTLRLEVVRAPRKG